MIEFALLKLICQIGKIGLIELLEKNKELIDGQYNDIAFNFDILRY
jgi:hypothetical protein